MFSTITLVGPHIARYRHVEALPILLPQTALVLALIFVIATSAELPANPRSEDEGERDVAEVLADPTTSLVRPA